MTDELRDTAWLTMAMVTAAYDHDLHTLHELSDEVTPATAMALAWMAATLIGPDREALHCLAAGVMKKAG